MLLERIINKKNSDLNELKDMLFYRNDEDRKQYMKNNYIPYVDFNILNFKEFFNKRQGIIKEKLTQVLSD